MGQSRQFLELYAHSARFTQTTHYPDVAAQDLHSTLLPYLLTFAVNIGILFAHHQYRKVSIFLHACICGFCGIAILATSLPKLIERSIWGGSVYMQRHKMIGIVIMSLMLLQMMMGVISKALQLWNGNSFSIFWLNRCHKVSGYLVIIICKVQVYLALQHSLNYKLFILLAADILTILFIVITKITSSQIQSSSLPLLKGEQTLPTIERLDSLCKEGQNLGIFANYVYNLQNLVRFHPMGYRIIKSVRGRQFDRFIYGSVSTEEYNSISTNHHSINSISLLGSPIAKLKIDPIYFGLDQDMIEVKILEMVQISDEEQMYEVRLIQKSEQGFPCKGYSSVNQIGRYFVLNLQETTSRLYITTSFLCPSNIQLLQNIYFTPNNIPIYSINMKPFNQNYNQPNVQTQRSIQLPPQKPQYLPLYIKKYAGGKLTHPLIEGKFTKLRLSTQRGQGLKLYNLKPSKIVIFISGTGIIPFGDLIDLLFKAVLIATHPQYKDVIISQNPILATKQLQGFSFRFYLQENHYELIHPLTRAQMIEVSKMSELLEFKLKCHNKIEDIRLKKSDIKLVNEGIEQLVKRQLQSESYTKIGQYLICCSPAINARLFSLLKQKAIPEQKYTFL